MNKTTAIYQEKPHSGRFGFNIHCKLLENLFCSFIAHQIVMYDSYYITNRDSFQSQVFQDQDLIVRRYSFVCNCSNYLWWIVGMLFYKAIILAFGLFLAYETRHAYKEINESRNIGFIVYNGVIFSIIAMVTAFALRKYEARELSYGIVGSSIIICTTITLVLVFFPTVELHLFEFSIHFHERNWFYLRSFLVLSISSSALGTCDVSSRLSCYSGLFVYISVLITYTWI